MAGTQQTTGNKYRKQDCFPTRCLSKFVANVLKSSVQISRAILQDEGKRRRDTDKEQMVRSTCLRFWKERYHNVIKGRWRLMGISGSAQTYMSCFYELPKSLHHSKYIDTLCGAGNTAYIIICQCCKLQFKIPSSSVTRNWAMVIF